jgi:hypothetical protein
MQSYGSVSIHTTYNWHSNRLHSISRDARIARCLARTRMSCAHVLIAIGKAMMPMSSFVPSFSLSSFESNLHILFLIQSSVQPSRLFSAERTSLQTNSHGASLPVTKKMCGCEKGRTHYHIYLSYILYIQYSMYSIYSTTVVYTVYTVLVLCFVRTTTYSLYCTTNCIISTVLYVLFVEF